MLAVFWAARVQGQSIDPISLVVSKIIKALDLQVQKLQNQTLSLQQLALVAEHQLSKNKLAEIAEWQEKQRALYDGYFKEMQTVRTSIHSLAHVKQITGMYSEIVREYRLFSRASFAKDDVLVASRDILQSMQRQIQDGLFAMKDAERLILLVGLRDAMQECLGKMQTLNKGRRQNLVDSLQKQTDIQFLKRLNTRP